MKTTFVQNRPSQKNRMPFYGIGMGVFCAVAGLFATLSSLPDPVISEVVAAEAVKDETPVTVEDLHGQFQSVGYDLNAVRSGTAFVPSIHVTAVPENLADIPVAADRKSLFLRMLLPLVLEANGQVERDRVKLLKLKARMEAGQIIPAQERIWLASLAAFYRVKPTDLESLVYRVDVVPVGLALAQAAIESGWGTSRFAREGNALFGQWTGSEGDGLHPDAREDGKNHKVRAFPSLLASVTAYIRNLNTHRAYREFRRERAKMRRAGKILNDMELARTLFRYSEQGKRYVRLVRRVIYLNQLHGYGRARLERKPLVIAAAQNS